MPDPTLFLGIDISTTSAKSLLIDTEGNVMATALRLWRFPRPTRCGPSRTRKIGGRRSPPASAKRSNKPERLALQWLLSA